MIDEKIAADAGARVNIDRREETSGVVDDAGEQIQPRAVQGMGDAVEGQRPHAGIKQDLPPRPRGRIACLDRIEVAQQVRHRTLRRRVRLSGSSTVFEQRS